MNKLSLDTSAAEKPSRSIGALGVFSIAAGAMISSGIFVLPGAAFERAGPAVILSYGVAGIIALIGTLSIVELATGMPKAGGDYFFITRSLGPLVGTMSGLLSWFALCAKSAFAIYGLSALLSLLTGVPILPVSLTLVVVFVAVNFLGAKSAVRAEIMLVVLLLAILGLLAVFGIPVIENARFKPFIIGGWNSAASAVGFVFVSFGGLINASSVSGEVKRPSRTIPVGILSAIVVVTALYVLSLIVTVGVLDADQLASSRTPLADAARVIFGPFGFAALAFGATLAFVTTAHAGILSASRYPFALAKDQLLPSFFGKITKGRLVPAYALLITGLMVGAASVISLEMLVTAASTIILSSYLLANVSVLVMRYSRLTSYRPSFRVRFTPVVQIISILLFLFFIADLGAVGLIIAGILALVSLGVYLLYGRPRHSGEYALLHLVERITNRAIAGDDLERELRDIIHEKDEVELDPIDQVFKEAIVLDLNENGALKELFDEAAKSLSAQLGIEAEKLVDMLTKREAESSTAISPFVAVPHLILEDPGMFRLLAIRAPNGIKFSETYSNVKGIFVLAGSADRRTLHLQTLAAIAQIAMDRRFEAEWMSARRSEQLREVLLLGERRRVGRDGGEPVG